MPASDSGKEFSRAVAVSALPLQGRAFDLSPTEAERAAIARRLDIPGVERLAGHIDVKPARGGATLSGKLSASLTRQCVVTLEPMTEEIAESFALRFVRAEPQTEAGEAELLIDEDTPEPLDGDVIDIGEALVQQLALAMSPYPRRPDADFTKAEFGQTLEKSPFDVLKGAIAERRDQE